MEFVYQGYDTTCLVELDESPPLEINQEALKIALQISILFNTKVLPIVQIMRKTVINGSNTSGFHRTVLIARDGYVETTQGNVGILSICLEEDAARIIEKTNKQSIYRLDRLGIPLVEIVTSPDIKNPEHAKETALLIGNILRSCNVKRGLGTIRQDINISIKGGKRIEIKGFQDPKIMIKTLDNEVNRQLDLINKKKNFESEVRNSLPDGNTEFLRPMPGAARMYPETDLPILKISKDFINEAKKTLPKLKTDVEDELQDLGLNSDMIKLLFKENKLEQFKEFLSIVNNPQLVLKVLLIYPKEVASHEKVDFSKADKILNYDVLSFVLEALKQKNISENDIKHVLERVLKGENIEKAIVFEKHQASDVEEKINKIIREKPGLSENAYMGLVMKEFKGKINGKEAMEIIQRLMK